MATRSKNKRRKKRRSSRVLLYLLLIFIAVITLIVLSFTVFFPIATINVSGNERYDKNSVVSGSGISIGDNLFAINSNKVNEKISRDLPYIDSVKIKRKLFSTIEIIVQEEVIYSQIAFENKFILIDSSKKVLEVSDTIKSSVPLLRGVKVKKLELGEKVEINRSFDMFDEFNAYLLENELKGITVIDLKKANDIRATYKNKIVLLFGSQKNLAKKVEHAKLTIEKRSSSSETGILNLSQISDTYSESSFIPTLLSDEQLAK